jgi:Cyclin, N-terminal domain
MTGYNESSHLRYWIFDSALHLQSCRRKASRLAREWITRTTKSNKAGDDGIDQNIQTSAVDSADCRDQESGYLDPTMQTPRSTFLPMSATKALLVPVHAFACGYSARVANQNEQLEPVLTEQPEGGGELVSASEEKTSKRKKKAKKENTGMDLAEENPEDDIQFLSVYEEEMILSFFAARLSSLIGPLASLPKLQRESKVVATAALLFRRFFVSNSVMIHDPKLMVVVAAWLASKVEDCMIDIKHLIEGAVAMDATLTPSEIVQAELVFISGIHFDLYCFHPLKSVLAFTEDLRTYLKSELGQQFIVFVDEAKRSDTDDGGGMEETHVVRNPHHVSGQDLKPIYDTARQILEDVVISDIPLLYSPAVVGLCSMIVAQEFVHDKYERSLQKYNLKQKVEESAKTVSDARPENELQKPPPQPIRIDIEGYLRQRFQGSEAEMIRKKYHGRLSSGNGSSNGATASTKSNDAPLLSANMASSDDTSSVVDQTLSQFESVCSKLREMRHGKWGCSGRYSISGSGSQLTENTSGGTGPDMKALKSVHKKLKKVRIWGKSLDSEKAPPSNKRKGDSVVAAVDSEDQATKKSRTE